MSPVLRGLSLAALALAGCFTPNWDYPREASRAIDPKTDTAAKRGVDEWLTKNPGPSAFYPLVRGTDALGARLRMIEAAERTIDVQSFLMKPDAAGFIFTAALLQAADRGVRIRFLLDDIFTSVSIDALGVIDAHPNLELRLFNPISRRGFFGLNFLGDFRRANRRMHNKSFIVDNQAAIVGGRNVADEYFELRGDGEFLDFDVIAFGPVAAQVSAEFDSYWNHPRSLPVAAVSGEHSEEELRELRDQIDDEHIQEARRIYGEAVESDLMREFAQSEVEFFSADATLVTDSPDKLVNDISEENMILVKEIAEIARASDSEVIVMSPYFVPGKKGVRFWKEIVDQGVRVVVITNSLASNNHKAVHSGYAGYRTDLVRAGVELYETRADAIDQPEKGEAGTKDLTLHTKAMIFDRERLFVGSLNLDPRSIEINSEMGLVIDSDELAGGIADAVLESLPSWTYRVKLDEKGRTRWHATIDGEEVVETHEPLTSCYERCVAWFLKIAPERQL